MIQETIAKKYARALIELALEGKKEERCGEELEAFATLVKGNAELWSFLTGPAGEKELKHATMGEILKKAKYLPLVDNFIRLLLDKERVMFIGEIARAYGRLLDEHRGKVKARLVSAAPLSSGEIKEIQKKLSDALKRAIVLEASVDPALIGGAVAYVGGRVFDGSIRTELNNIRDNLKKGHMS
jgi:F-type H+-transporting ATPase subunit delta